MYSENNNNSIAFEYARPLLTRLAEVLLQNEMTLVTAESCTGGLAGAICTSLPGSSSWFKGGVISYANEIKTALLGVAPALLSAHGAVSKEVALAMARGASNVLSADCSIAITGIAGPDGGSNEKPVGTVWMATAIRSVKAKKVREAQKIQGRVGAISDTQPIEDWQVSASVRLFSGNRDRIREQATLHVLQHLLFQIEGKSV